MRYVILGAGAIGGAMGGRLFESGHEVVLVARGAHQAAISGRGLELRDPDRSVTLRIRAVSSPAEVGFKEGDVAVLATKTQQSEALLLQLAACAPATTPVVCAQNGVANEPLALRRFSNVQAMRVFVSATHLEPGVIEIPFAPLTGLLDLGRYPTGVDEVSKQMAADLNGSTFDSIADPNVMARKYRKLVSNLGNAIEAACGHRSGEAAEKLLRLAQEEAARCFEAAAIEVAPPEFDAERRAAMGPYRLVGDHDLSEGSSWQSLARHTGNIEADWLNGEIVLLGRLHAISTPVNELLRATANRMAAEGAAPGSIAAEELLAQL
ncbi:MAG: 2-dehydropantoate 2-reductase N-terminal domain-containing protein [Acidimicrobiales bacterium]|jgi:2-dehydropantoate 2-reductase